MTLILFFIGIVTVFGFAAMQLGRVIAEIDRYYENAKDIENSCTIEDYKFSVRW
ncbi:MAG: hypothetical protein M0R05_07310 [Bacilli bacterium]|nr:hypothetical protein [Bacilli bacterium]MDD4077065.1 hypothetical protein [Bacilli bacterium]